MKITNCLAILIMLFALLIPEMTMAKKNYPKELSLATGDTCADPIALTRGSFRRTNKSMKNVGFSGAQPDCADANATIKDVWFKATADEIGSLHFIIADSSFKKIAVGYTIYSTCGSVQQCSSIPASPRININAILLPPNRVPNKEWLLQIWTYADQNLTVAVRAVRECGITKATLSEPTCVNDTTFQQSVEIEHFNVPSNQKLFAEYNYEDFSHNNVIVDWTTSPTTINLPNLDASSQIMDLKLAATGECELVEYKLNSPIPDCGGEKNCPKDLLLFERTTLAGIYQASEKITTRNVTTITQPTTFRAGDTITLEMGFSTVAGVSFTAEIASCATATLVEKEELLPIAKLNQSNLPQLNNSLKVYPNPFYTSTTIHYQLVTSSQVNITLVDIAGRTMKTLQNTIQSKGIYQVQLDATDLTTGLYFLKANLGQEVQVEKVYLLK